MTDHHSVGSGSIPTPSLQFSALDANTAKVLIEKYHYKHHLATGTQYAFGLVVDGQTQATITYGNSASPQVGKSLLRSPFPFLELTRLVIRDGIPKRNLASRLISWSIKQLPSPLIIISYADTAEGHVGTVYQASNFIYSGQATSHDSLYLVNGRIIHPRTLASRGITNPKQWARANNIEMIVPKPKHRYIYLRGNIDLNIIKWPMYLPYPNKI